MSVAFSRSAGRKISDGNIDEDVHLCGDGDERHHGKLGHREVAKLLLFLEELEACFAEQVGAHRYQLNEELLVLAEVVSDLA